MNNNDLDNLSNKFDSITNPINDAFGTASGVFSALNDPMNCVLVGVIVVAAVFLLGYLCVKAL